MGMGTDYFSGRDCYEWGNTGCKHPANTLAINSSKDHMVLDSMVLVGKAFHSMVLVDMVLDMDRSMDLCRSNSQP